MFKLSLFKSKKKPLKTPEKKLEKTDLQLICEGEPQVYKALCDTMLLNPHLAKTSMEEAAKTGDYRIAGGLAILKGNVQKVKEYFGKYSEVYGKKMEILEPGITEKAVLKAQQYYAEQKTKKK